MAITRATTMSKRKRKHSEITADIIDLTQDDTPPTAQQFRFLDFAPELRNNIYEKLLEDATIEIRRRPPTVASRKKGKKQKQESVRWQQLLRLPEESFALALTNKQVREELLSIALTAVPLHARVFDADFGHVVAFLNKLGSVELDRLVSREKAQEVHIWLDVGQYSWPEPKLMVRWLKRMNSSTKNGFNIDYIYHTEPRRPVAMLEGDGSGIKAWISSLRGGGFNWYPRSVRYQEEAKKILDVLNEA